MDIIFPDWDVERLQLAVWHTPPSPSGLWAKLVGTEPEATDTRPRERLVQEYGIYEGNNLRLTLQPQRLDWYIEPSAPPTPEPKQHVALISVDRTLPLLQRALAVSLSELDTIVRLAAVIHLIHAVDNISHGMAKLDKYLPELNLKERGDQDFIYQINRRQRSPSTRHVFFNRIATWRLDRIQTGIVQMGPAQEPTVSKFDPILACRLSLDMNTVPSPSAIAKTRMPKLFEELVASAQYIAIHGDVV